MKRVEQHHAKQNVREFLGGESGQPMEKAQRFLLAGEFHQLQDDAQARVVLPGGRVEAGEIEQRMVEFR